MYIPVRETSLKIANFSSDDGRSSVRYTYLKFYIYVDMSNERLSSQLESSISNSFHVRVFNSLYDIFEYQ